jgi:hypothetical protein
MAECAPLPEIKWILGPKSRKPNHNNGLVGARIPRPPFMRSSFNPLPESANRIPRGPTDRHHLIDRLTLPLTQSIAIVKITNTPSVTISAR